MGLRSRWWIVLASVLGLLVGNGPVMQFTFGTLLPSITRAIRVESRPGLFRHGRGTLDDGNHHAGSWPSGRSIRDSRGGASRHRGVFSRYRIGRVGPCVSSGLHCSVRTNGAWGRRANAAHLRQGDLGTIRSPARACARHRDGGSRPGRCSRSPVCARDDRYCRLAGGIRRPRGADLRSRFPCGSIVRWQAGRGPEGRCAEGLDRRECRALPVLKRCEPLDSGLLPSASSLCPEQPGASSLIWSPSCRTAESLHKPPPRWWASRALP